MISSCTFAGCDTSHTRHNEKAKAYVKIVSIRKACPTSNMENIFTPPHYHCLLLVFRGGQLSLFSVPYFRCAAAGHGSGRVIFWLQENSW
ncbi:hypothetical protein GUJ93_ZPchr0013g37217 [Zizania palustris]|uniref:Uncharacterized protein n=1 Tax=Zizania palustris TaxID=103762 RepID=A0A8J5X2L6_ZIZPA|nr:hypothetical protein GUJ93_ZPchr0013g37217 [Zizania palustris]